MASRRRLPPVLVILGVVVAVIVIVVLALPGSQSSPDQQSYLDIVRPQLQLSAQQGAVVRDMRANAASFDRTALFQRLNDLVSAAAGVQQQVALPGAPGSLGSSGGDLNQAMRMRAQGVSSLRDGMQSALSGAPSDQATTQLARAGQQLGAADGLYGSFLRALSRSQAASIAVPQYRWILNPPDWDPQALSLYVLSLRLSPSLAVHHDVAVVLVSTQPAPTSYNGPVAILGLARQLTVSVVVANNGNATEHDVPVVATLASGQTQSARAVVDIDPGQRRAVDLGGLSLGPRKFYILTVTVGPVAGDPTPADNQQTTVLAVSG
ncbi:MAG TPA: hypothetical protein VF005_05530 [Acidimicrobiales bacterium]